MDGKEHEMDRKNKHCRRPEEHHSTDGFGGTRSLVGRYMELGTPETHCSLLPSRQTLIRQ